MCHFSVICSTFAFGFRTNSKFVDSISITELFILKQIEYENEPAIIEAALFEQDQLRAIKKKLEPVVE